MALLLLTGCAGKEEETTPDIPANSMTPASSSNPLPAPSGLNTTTAMLNPAHGQPGHRCDIAVGAPLDSKPVQPVPQATTPENAPKLNTSPANGVSTAGLNPSHGQPGHRCDIPVGAPLNSKPSK